MPEENEGNVRLNDGLGRTLDRHEGPICKGDVIVVEILGKLVPKRPDDPRPQWFIALDDEGKPGGVPLKPIDANEFYNPRIYQVCWKA